MDTTLSLWLGTTIILLLGSLLHFTYDFSHENKFVAFFSAVNESTWEHIKIAFTPTLLWTFYDISFYGSNPNYLIAKTLSLALIIILIPAIFYFYQVFTKKPILPIDISLFFVSILISQTVFYFILSINPLPSIFMVVSIILLIVMFVAYLSFTFFPPRLSFFRDPLTKKYGIHAHSKHKKCVRKK